MKNTYEFLKEKLQTVTPDFSYDGVCFDSWKNEARKKLGSLIGLDKFEKVAPETKIEFTNKIEGATEIRFTFQSEKGYNIPCHLLLPDNIPNPPVVICLQGHSSGIRVSLGKPQTDYEIDIATKGDCDFAVRAVKEGFAAVALEQRNFGELSNDVDCLSSSMNSLLMGRTTIGERVWDIQRLIDVLEDEFPDKIDIGCISILGNSGGGTATIYTAALDDRIVLAIPSCAVASFKDSIGALKHCPCNYVPNISNVFEMSDLISMACPKYFIQVSGKEDDIFPLFSAQSVFEKGKKAYDDNNVPERCVLVEGNGGHRFFADDTWPIVHKLLGK